MTRETETQRGTGRGLLTARLEGMSSVTWLLATSHSRYRIGRGRTLCVGCAQGTWREAPAQRKSWPEGPAGSDLGKGHFPHRSYKRKERQSGHLRTAEDSVHTQRISGTAGQALPAKHRRWLQSFPFCPEEAEFYKLHSLPRFTVNQ